MSEAKNSLTWAVAVAAVLGATGVGMAAYASHGLGFIADESAREAARATLQHAVQQQLLHAPVLLALGLWGSVAQRPAPWCMKAAAVLLVLGLLLFSGLIYAKILLGFAALSALVPVGGMCLMAAWLLLLPAAFKLGARG